VSPPKAEISVMQINGVVSGKRSATCLAVVGRPAMRFSMAGGCGCARRRVYHWRLSLCQRSSAFRLQVIPSKWYVTCGLRRCSRCKGARAVDLTTDEVVTFAHARAEKRLSWFYL
jgi:hypothetical protein